MGMLAKAWPPPKDEEEEEEMDEEEDNGKKKKKLPPWLKSAPDENTESVVIEGETISKAEVGDAVFNVLKAQSERIEKADKEIQKAKDEAELERLKKRADDMYSHVPGTTDERASILKAMSAMPEGLRKSMEKVMLQSEKLAKSAFERVGTSGGRDPADMQKSKIDFEKKVAEIAKRDGVSRVDAMAKARLEDPEAFKAFQGN
jgi:predicted enzyme involved in methoxymalonyl-ACP biosynthesis